VPRYLLRDRDTSYGLGFRDRVRAMDIEEVVTAPSRIIGSIRRECLDYVIIFSKTHLRRVLSSYFRYYDKTGTHLSLNKHCPDSRRVQLASAGKIVALPEVSSAWTSEAFSVAPSISPSGCLIPSPSMPTAATSTRCSVMWMPSICTTRRSSPGDPPSSRSSCARSTTPRNAEMPQTSTSRLPPVPEYRPPEAAPPDGISASRH
jgi:hypothetical protein